jgi:hypothetical protein
MLPPPLFTFSKVSSLGPAIKRFNRDVVSFLRDSKQELHEVYGVDAFEGFAPTVIVIESGVPAVSPLALEFVRVTGLSFGDVYPNVLSTLAELGLTGETEENAA